MPSLAVTSVVDAVATALRNQLFSGGLVGGHPVTEAAISQNYDVARPTAKAAIEQLVAEGLLQRTAHKTAKVPVLGPDQVRDIYRTRARLEGEALRELAAQRSVPDAARRANERIGTSADDNGLSIVEPDMQFHSALIDELDSPRLSRMYGSLTQEVRLCMAQVQGRNLLTTALIKSEHERIMINVANGDAEAAVALLHTHLSRARERLVKAIGGSPSAEAELES